MAKPSKFSFLDNSQELIILSDGCFTWIFLRTYSLFMWSLNEMFNNLLLDSNGTRPTALAEGAVGVVLTFFSHELFFLSLYID